MKKLAALIVTAALSCSGCLSAAVGYTAYKVAETSRENMRLAARSVDTRNYVQYRVAMSRVNLEREKAGLKAERIMTEAEWLAARAQ